MTEKVYEELDDAKAEIEKLRSEHRVKSDLCDSLKRSHNDQIKRIQELNLKLEKQAEELVAKTDEIYASKQSLEDLERKLKDKENFIKSFTSTNDKLRSDFSSKLQECEDEKIELVSSLAEANIKILDLEQKNRVFMDKIETLKEGILSVSQKKCASESKMAKASKQMRERGDLFEKLEEEKMKLEEQIKWKNEQFKHLEEAHEKLRGNLRTKEKEWDMEKSSFYDEISTLESKLDSQIRLSEDLQRRLELSNQALAHEETQRKSQIQEAKNSSAVAKLEKKLKTLEHIHNECSHLSEVKEAEWRSKLEKVVADLSSCRLELEKKEIHLKEITTELDNHKSLVLQLTMEKEDLKSTLLEARLKIDDLVKTQKHIDLENLEKVCADLNSCKLELEKKETHLKEITTELDNHNSLVSQLTMEKEELKSTLLEARLKIDDLVKIQEHTEIEFLEMVEKEKLLLHKDMKNVSDLLDRANKELAEKSCEVNEVEFELQIWKSVAENLQVNLEVNHGMRRELEASLLAQVETEVSLKEENKNLACVLEEKEKKINDLEQELEQSKKDINNLSKSAKEKGEKLEKEIEWWEKEWVTKELEAAILSQLESEKIHEYEKQNLNQLVEEKDQRINNLEKIMKCLEEEFSNSSASFSSQLTKMQSEMNLFHEAWEKIRTTVVLKEIEVQQKDLMILEMEKDLKDQVEFEKKCLFTVKKLSSEKEKLMDIIGGVSERINKLSREDGLMMGTLRSIMSSFDDNRGELKDYFDPVKENTNVYQSPKRRNMVESDHDDRSPLRDLNG